MTVRTFWKERLLEPLRILVLLTILDFPFFSITIAHASGNHYFTYVVLMPLVTIGLSAVAHCVVVPLRWVKLKLPIQVIRIFVQALVWAFILGVSILSAIVSVIMLARFELAPGWPMYVFFIVPVSVTLLIPLSFPWLSEDAPSEAIACFIGVLAVFLGVAAGIRSEVAF